MQTQNQNQGKVPSKKVTLVGLVGITCASILTTMIPQEEGIKYIGYRDVIGIPTKCMGDTTDVTVGKKYTPAECLASMDSQLIAHAEPILKCNPVLKNHPYQLAAAISFGYNIGVTKYCNSVASKRFNLGDFKGACKAFNESDTGKPQYVTAGGIVFQGLVKRRKNERALCETGLYTKV